MNLEWPFELAEAAKALYESGDYSCAQIGKRIGKSRNAVIGKASRGGWVNPNPSRGGAPNGNRNNTKGYLDHRQIELPPEPAMPPEFKNLTIHELTKHTCKFPHGDQAPFLYCGADVHARSYCKFHHGLCYYPVTQNRRINHVSWSATTPRTY